MSFDDSLFCKVAQHPKPETFPPNVYVAHTKHTITIFDGYPKADYHFLVIPRVLAEKNGNGNGKPFERFMTPGNLMSLKSFLHAPGMNMEVAREFLGKMKEDAEALREEIEADMVRRRGFVWKLHIGFHAVQSMK